MTSSKMMIGDSAPGQRPHRCRPGSAGGRRSSEAPEVPAALAAPAGAKVLARFHATGAQVYACTSAGGQYSWVLARPDATLADASGRSRRDPWRWPELEVERWQLRGREEARAGGRARRRRGPLAPARRDLDVGGGAIHRRDLVQRVATKGGIAPTTGRDATHLGTEVRANYSADYYFYTGGVETAEEALSGVCLLQRYARRDAQRLARAGDDRAGDRPTGRSGAGVDGFRADAHSGGDARRASRDSDAVRAPGARAVLVNVWATWCDPVAQEMPDLIRFYRDHREDGLRLVLVSAGRRGGSCRGRAGARRGGAKGGCRLLHQARRGQVSS